VDLNLSDRGEIPDSFGSDYTRECAVRSNTKWLFNYTDCASSSFIWNVGTRLPV